jgi:hypothetical protein
MKKKDNLDDITEEIAKEFLDDIKAELNRETPKDKDQSKERKIKKMYKAYNNEDQTTLNLFFLNNGDLVITDTKRFEILGVVPKDRIKIKNKTMTIEGVHERSRILKLKIILKEVK